MFASISLEYKFSRNFAKLLSQMNLQISIPTSNMASQVVQWYRICLPMQETRVPSLGQEDALEKEMATHSSVLAWKIPSTEYPDGLQSMGSQRVRHS